MPRSKRPLGITLGALLLFLLASSILVADIYVALNPLNRYIPQEDPNAALAAGHLPLVIHEGSEEVQAIANFLLLSLTFLAIPISLTTAIGLLCARDWTPLSWRRFFGLVGLLAATFIMIANFGAWGCAVLTILVVLLFCFSDPALRERIMHRLGLIEEMK